MDLAVSVCCTGSFLSQATKNIFKQSALMIRIERGEGIFKS